MSEKIRIFHVEDYQIMRDAVRYLLGREENFDIIGSAGTSKELITELRKANVDVLIMDLYLDGMEQANYMHGFEIARAIRTEFPSIKIIAHSAYDDADRIERILKVGASGFVSKKSGFQELIAAVNAVYAGEIYICRISRQKLKNLNKFLAGLEDNLKGKDELFSAREREILELLADGESSAAIAEKLNISERTVESHRKNMLVKAKAKNTVELIGYAFNIGLLKK